MKILVIDDHPLIREGMRLSLKALDSHAEILEAQSAEEAFALADENPELDLVLLDVNLPGMSGLCALQKYRQLHPAVPVVVLSAADDREQIMQAIDAGAMGYIPKSSKSAVMLNALRLVLSGGIYLPPEALGREEWRSMKFLPPLPSEPARPNLTERQLEVLRCLVEGKPNKLICRELNMAEGTVKTHITAILKSLNVTTRTQAVIEVARLGFDFRRTSARGVQAG
ncbi:MAG: response regulator [Burkholderiales bacterium]